MTDPNLIIAIEQMVEQLSNIHSAIYGGCLGIALVLFGMVLMRLGGG